MTNITIIDTQCANLSSVKFAFERLGYSAEITNDLNKIKSADKLILPGVGTAKAAMLNLQRLGLVEGHPKSHTARARHLLRYAANDGILYRRQCLHPWFNEWANRADSRYRLAVVSYGLESRAF